MDRDRGNKAEPGTDVPIPEADLSLTAAATTPRSRRWLRRLGWSAGVVVLGLVGAGLFRHSILASAIPSFLPQILADKLGVPVQVGEVAVRAAEDGGLLIELRQIVLGDAAIGRNAALPAIPAAEPIVISATLDRLRLRLTGWLAFREGLDGVRGVELDSLDLVLPKGTVAERAEGAEFPSLEWIAPETLPEVPFPLHIAHFSVRRGELSAVGSLHTREKLDDPNGFELELDRIEGVPSVETGNLVWSPAGSPQFRIGAYPIQVESEGRLEREGDRWRLQATRWSGRGYHATFDARVPVAAGCETTVELDFELDDSIQMAAGLGLGVLEGMPEQFSMKLDTKGLAGEWSGKALIESSAGNFELEMSTASSDGRRRLLVEAASEDFEIGADALPVDPAGEGMVTAAAIDRLRLRFAGWIDFREKLDGVLGVELTSLDLVLPEGTEKRKADDEEIPSFELIAPETLPALPFPLHIARFSVRRGELSAVGSLTQEEIEDPNGFRLEFARIEGVPGIVSGLLEWSPGALDSAPQISVTASPIDLVCECRLEREGEQWHLQATQLSGDGFLASFDGRVPTVAGGETTIDLDVEVYYPLLLVASLGLGEREGLPDYLALQLDTTCLAGEWSGEGQVQSSVGDFGLEVSTVKIGGEQRLLVEGASEELAIGSIASPWLSGRLLIATGSAELWGEWGGGAPLFGGSLDIGGGSFQVKKEEGEPLLFRRFSTLAEWSPGGPLEIETSFLDLPSGHATFEGQLPLAANQEWGAEVVGHELRLEEFVPTFALSGTRGVKGGLEIDGTITGPAGDPEPQITGELRGGEIALQGWERIRNIDANLSWEGEALVAEQIAGEIDGEGVQGEGRMTFAAGRVTAFDSEVRFRSIRLFRSSSLRARGGGVLRFVGTPDEPRIEGEVTIIRGIYDRDIHPSFAGGGSTVPFDLFRLESGFPSRLAFDVSVDLAGNFEVRNNRVRVSPYGKLKLGGTGYQPVLTGTITASEGQVLLPRINFEIVQVEVQFPDDDPFHPRLQFLGRGIVRDVEIDAAASGELFAPVVTFSSSPSYPQDDLILLVATGRFRNQIDASDVGIVAATELAQLYGPQVWGAIFGPSASGGDGLLDRLQVGVNVSEETGDFDTVSVEYPIKEWFRRSSRTPKSRLSVYGEQDADGQMKADLRFFWWVH